MATLARQIVTLAKPRVVMLLVFTGVCGVYAAAGGSSPYRTSALQRCFRDIHVVTQHAMVAQPIFEATGRVLLGDDPERPL